MKLINEQEIYSTWAPLIESKAGITDESKKGWLTKYCHYHSLNESAGAYNSLGVVNGMGAVAPPLFPGMSSFTGNANAGFYNTANQGSGDKFPSLLPLAIQVAAKTVGFDIVPVIPMSGPTGILSYLDYIYSGGKIGSAGSTAGATLADAPSLIKFSAGLTGSPSAGVGAATAGFGSSNVGTTYYIGATGTVTSISGHITAKFVGLSRIDGNPIYEIDNIGTGWNVASIVAAGALISSSTTVSTANSVGVVTSTASLVKALEDHIQGFSGAGFSNTNDWQGPYIDGTKTYDPMLRSTGESTYYNSMGLSTFTKFVEAETFQVAASVTTEQIQDLNKQFGIDVISMIENALVNEVSQAINKHILSRAFALGWSNHVQFNAVDNQNLNLNLSTTAASNTLAYVGKTNATTSMTVPGQILTNNFENQSTLQRRLFSRILAAANVVANRGRRGPANFIVTNANVL
jgi:hypothetical protein